MQSKKHKPEEIIGELPEVENMLAQGASTAKACRRIVPIAEQLRLAHCISTKRIFNSAASQWIRRKGIAGLRHDGALPS